MARVAHSTMSGIQARLRTTISNGYTRGLAQAPGHATQKRVEKSHVRALSPQEALWRRHRFAAAARRLSISLRRSIREVSAPQKVLDGDERDAIAQRNKREGRNVNRRPIHPIDLQCRPYLAGGCLVRGTRRPIAQAVLPQKIAKRERRRVQYCRTQE